MGEREDKQRIDTLQSVELADGVEVKVRIAGAFPRAMAAMVDLIFMFILFFVSVWVIVFIFMALAISGVESESFVGWVLIYLFVFVWFYNFIFERGKKAATWGKRIFGLKVASTNGTRATAKQVFVRNILRAADLLPGAPLALIFTNPQIQESLMYLGVGMLTVGTYGVGLASCLFTSKFQRIGDLVAGTLVVHTKEKAIVTAQLPEVIAVKMPRLKILREEEVAIRNFCERGGMWSPARRAELANYADELTGKHGDEAVMELAAYSNWIANRD